MAAPQRPLPVEAHLCFEHETPNLTHYAGTLHDVAVIERMDEVATLQIDEIPTQILEAAREVCGRCAKLEPCRTDAERLLAGEETVQIELKGKPPYFMGGIIVDNVDGSLQSLDVLYLDVPSEQCAIPAENPANQTGNEQPEEISADDVIKAPVASEHLSPYEEIQQQLLELIESGPQTFHRLLTELRTRTPTATPDDLRRHLNLIRKKVLASKRSFGTFDKQYEDSFVRIFGIDQTEEQLTAAADAAAKAAQNKVKIKDVLPKRDGRGPDSLKEEIESFCLKHDGEFLVGVYEGKLMGWQQYRGAYCWRELIGAPSAYHLHIVKALLTNKAPTDLLTLYKHLSGKKTITAQDNQSLAELANAFSTILDLFDRIGAVTLQKGQRTGFRDATNVQLVRFGTSKTS